MSKIFANIGESLDDCLTPGRQRSYVIALSLAQKSATRVARIVAFRGKILAGKGAMER
jgi:uncharacterized protein YdeI (YjbR/CyaY-like superfamily)